MGDSNHFKNLLVVLWWLSKSSLAVNNESMLCISCYEKLMNILYNEIMYIEKLCIIVVYESVLQARENTLYCYLLTLVKHFYKRLV